MRRASPVSTLVAFVLLATTTQAAYGDEILVATASNFASTMRDLCARFKTLSPYSVSVIPGSTGKHFAQIINGAPFDVFFAADSRRPRALEKRGLIVAGTRFTYALGRVALWSRQADLIDPAATVLKRGAFRHLALANPRLAPYGIAARETLQHLGVWDRLNKRRVLGENIAQTFQFVRSGNAELGFIAYSQLLQNSIVDTGSHWLVPIELHRPIVQQAVLLRDNDASRALLAFVQSAAAKDIMARDGYGLAQ